MTVSAGKIHYVDAKGKTFDEMRDALINSDAGQQLISRGDVCLVWVNQGDIDIHNLNVGLGHYISKSSDGV